MKLKNIFADIPANLLKKIKKAKQPTFINPMLATLTKDYFSSKDWFYEHKFDGVRCLAYKKNGKVTLLSRNNNKMNNTYPEIAFALEQQTADNFIIDGEIIAKESGISNFELLQSRINLQNIANVQLMQKKVPIIYCIFDLPYVNGYNIEDLPLFARKNILERLLDYNKMLVYTKHKVGNGIEFFKKACSLKWEGLIAKRFDSLYERKRSRHWLKFKCSEGQELVIGGYTEPQGSRANFGALLVGYYKDNKLQYAGKVGTGYTQEILKELGIKLQKLESAKCPFSNYDGKSKNVHWVKPKLVAEFEFAQWTNKGKLRVGRYKGLRNDKNAKLVVKEIPK